MFRFKIFISITIISVFLIGTSFIKNQTRDIEKKIYSINKKISLKERDYNESQLDFFYLTSPFIIDKKIEHLDNTKYVPMSYSKIFLSLNDFINLEKKFAIKDEQNEKKIQKK